MGFGIFLSFSLSCDASTKQPGITAFFTGSLATKPPPFHQPQPVPASSHHESPVFPQRQGPTSEAPGAEADEPQQTTADDVKEYLLEQFKAVSEHLSDCEDYMALSEQLSSESWI